MVIDASGDLDLTTVSTLEEHYKSVQSHLSKMSESQTLILDLRKITFIDSAGLAYLVRISQDMIGSQHRFNVVVRENGQPERVIKLGQFGTVLNVVYDYQGSA